MSFKQNKYQVYNSADIKILLVGCGYWGKNWYNTIKNSEYELVGVVDLNPIIKVDVPLFDDISLVDIDYNHIILSIPPENIKSTLDKINLNSNNILIEKPCGLSKKDVNSFGEFYSGFIFLSSPEYKYIKNNINSIGNPIYFNSFRASMGPRIRTDVSILEDYLIHDLYIFMGLFGNDIDVNNVFVSHKFEEPVKEDTISLGLISGGVRADMFSSWWYPMKDRKIVIVGEKGSFIWKNEQLFFYNGYYAKINGVDENRNVGYNLENGDVEEVSFDKSESNLELELKDFIEKKSHSVAASDVWNVIEEIKNEF